MHDIDVQIIQVDEWHVCLFPYELMKNRFHMIIIIKAWHMKFVM